MYRLISLLAILTLTLGATVAFAQPVSTLICDVRADGDGDCVADDVDSEVCVTGIVTAWKHFGVRGPGAIYDPNSGCSISIFDIDALADQPLGTEVQVCGWIGNFSGLDEIVDNPADAAMDPTVTVLGSTSPLSPVAITGADMADGSATAEGLESSLVSVCGTFEQSGGTFETFSANYVFVDQDGTSLEVRIDSDTGIGGTPIPAGAVTVTGIVSQFDGFGANLCGGYQLLPRGPSDFEASDCVPVSTQQQSWSEIKSRFEN